MKYKLLVLATVLLLAACGESSPIKHYQCTPESAAEAGKAYASCLILGVPSRSGGFTYWKAEECGKSAFIALCKVEVTKPRS